VKILVTGGDGFLGSAVLRSLRATDANIVAISRRGSVGAITCDLSNPGDLVRMLDEVLPDCIVNVAAEPNFGPGALSLIYPANFLAPAIMAAYCKRVGAYLIQTSGSIVHGFQYTRFNIETPCEPNLDYGVSKLLADKAILSSGCRAAIVRFGGIFGDKGPSHLGINKAIAQAKMGVRPQLFGAGLSKRNYSYVQDGAAMIAKCVDRQLEGIFYAGGEVISLADMLNAICNVFLPGEQPEVVEGKDSSDQLVDVSPELGPYRSFRDALNDMQ
jgi:dTDP-4-dehydrorhamnose reductase